ncbi:MAG: transposase [Methanophagales archaeon]|nr:transposase [Methanophagales archaeon]
MKRRGRGRPYYPPKGMALLAVMMFKMALSEREYVNWLKTNKWLIELAELPNTPDRRSIKRVFERTPLEYWERLEAEIQKIIPDSKVYGVDSTGLKQSKRTGAWSDKNNRRKDFKKLHIIADLVNRAIVVQKLTEGRRHDSPVFKEMMDDVESVDKMTGDPAYLSRDNCEIVADKGGKPYFKPKKNVTPKPKGSQAWKEMIMEWLEKTKKFLREYHIRSVIEAMIWSFKCIVGDIVRFRKNKNILAEIILKKCIFNAVWYVRRCL